MKQHDDPMVRIADALERIADSLDLLEQLADADGPLSRIATMLERFESDDPPGRLRITSGE